MHTSQKQRGIQPITESSISDENVL